MVWGPSAALGRVVPVLVVAAALCVESFGRWGELGAGLVGIAVAGAFFRRFPAVVVACAVIVVVVPVLVLGPGVTSPARVWPYVAVAVFSYLAGRRLGAREQRAVPVAVGGVLAAGLPVGVWVAVGERGGFGVLFGLYDWFLLVLALLAVAGGPWLLGRYRRQRVELHAAGLERAALLERTRIAREMHDSLGHELGLVALRAAALEMSPHLDDDTRARAGELRAGVTTATERLHEIVGLLGEQAPDLERLVERAIAAGQDVTLAVTGDQAEAAAVHRVVREGLTNAARHAPGAPVAVRVAAGERSTTVTVENRLSAGESGGGAGSGIDGLREIGDVTAGPRGDRFVLQVVMPHGDPGQRSARERPPLWRLARVPLAAAGVVLVLAFGLYFLAGADNRLAPAVYEQLHIGQSQEDVEKVLPSFQILGDPERMLTPPPRAADCRHYWATVQTDERLFYRLCFVDDRLAVKETVPRAAMSR